MYYKLVYIDMQYLKYGVLNAYKLWSTIKQSLLKISIQNRDEGYICCTDCISADWGVFGDAKLTIILWWNLRPWRTMVF